MSAPKPVVHRPLRFIEPPEKDTYKSYLDRIAVIHCVGSPRHYSLTNIQDALISAKVPSDFVEGMAPFTRYKRVIPTEQKHNGTLTVAAWARKVILLFVLGPKGLKI